MKAAWVGLGALIAVAVPAQGMAPSGGDIEIAVSGIRSAQGIVRVAICPKASFLGKCPWNAEAPARAEGVTITIHDVPPGNYAILAFHDRNGNGQLDRRMFGIPREDIGFSRLHRLPMRAPRFEDAEFAHGGADQRVPVVLSYYF